MSTKKRIYTVCAALVLLLTVIAVLIGGGIAPAFQPRVSPPDYESKLFAQDRIHSIQIFLEDWQGLLESSAEEASSVCSVIINKEQFDNVGIRALGTGFGRNRYSLTLEFDRYDSSQRYHGLDKLNLNNLAHDNTMMKDYLTYQLMDELGSAAPLCSYATVYVNKKALGVYLAVEGIAESFLLRNYGNAGGVLYCPDAGDTSQENLLRDVKLQYIDDDPDSYPHIFDHARTPMTLEDQKRLIASLKLLSAKENLASTVDMEAVIRYFVVNSFVCSEDSYTGTKAGNYYLYEKDGKLSMLPRNYNLAFGGSSSKKAAEVINSSIYTPVSGGELQDRPMLSWIFESRKYTWLYQRYYVELMYVNTEDRIDQTAKMIRRYVERDPSRLCTYEEFEAAVAALKQFLKLRSESVHQQLSNKPGTVDAGDLDLSAMGGQ